MTYRITSFANVPIGTEFMWGGYCPEDSNWGRKRSSRTADWRPRLGGELSEHMDWGYWKQNESVYVSYDA